MEEIIFMNFFSYDWIIFLTASLDAVIVIWLSWAVKSFDKIMRARKGTAFNDISENDVCDKRKSISFWYSIFVNITGCFTLFGILGTVISLLSLVSDSSDVTGSFYGALTSTMWGIIFAIIFKIADAFLSAWIEENEKNFSLYRERKSKTIKKTEKEKVLI